MIRFEDAVWESLRVFAERDRRSIGQQVHWICEQWVAAQPRRRRPPA